MNIYEGKHAIYLGASAVIVEEDRELAWAEKHVVRNPAYKWILGRYVEADRANRNGHIFPLDDLREAQPSIAHSPLNLLHRPHYIVGAFAATEMIYPTGEGESAASALAEPEDADNPFIEALAAFWRYYFNEDFQLIEKAHGAGKLFLSMEAVPEQLSCTACDGVFDYEGRDSPTYCAHMRAPRAPKRLVKPHFTGGALIIPPIRPGWARADVKEIGGLLEQRAVQAETLYDEIAADAPHLEPQDWEAQMMAVMAFADLER